MKITLSKAIQILDINLKEAAKSMPSDVKTTLELALDNLVGLRTERYMFGYTRLGQLPHEEPDIKPAP